MREDSHGRNLLCSFGCRNLAWLTSFPRGPSGGRTAWCTAPYTHSGAELTQTLIGITRRTTIEGSLRVPRRNMQKRWSGVPKLVGSVPNADDGQFSQHNAQTQTHHVCKTPSCWSSRERCCLWHASKQVMLLYFRDWCSEVHRAAHPIRHLALGQRRQGGQVFDLKGVEMAAASAAAAATRARAGPEAGSGAMVEPPSEPPLGRSRRRAATDPSPKPPAGGIRRKEDAGKS